MTAPRPQPPGRRQPQGSAPPPAGQPARGSASNGPPIRRPAAKSPGTQQPQGTSRPPVPESRSAVPPSPRTSGSPLPKPDLGASPATPQRPAAKLPTGETLRVAPSVFIVLAEIEFTYTRSSGPGGQNVNKVNSRANLRWNMAAAAIPEAVKTRFRTLFPSYVTNDGEVLLGGQQYRDQARNREDCLERLRSMLLEAATVPKYRKKTRVPRGVKERRLKDKRQQSDRKNLRRPPGDD